jgi:hypothetical protein
MFEPWNVELDDPPSPKQLQLWSRVRERGRTRYLCVGLLWCAITIFCSCLIPEALVYVLFGRHLDLATFLIAVWLLPVAMWFVFRAR